jgi:hypothetical protein
VTDAILAVGHLVHEVDLFNTLAAHLALALLCACHSPGG